MIKRILFKTTVVMLTLSTLKTMANKHYVKMDLCNKIVNAIKESVMENEDFFKEIADAVMDDMKNAFPKIEIGFKNSEETNKYHN